MDFFGIGTAIQACFNIYRTSARGTGRTKSLVDSVKEWDRVIFATDVSKRNFANRCADAGKNHIDMVVCHPDNIHTLYGLGKSIGRTYLDHELVELMYCRSIDQVQKEIDHLQERFSDREPEPSTVARWKEQHMCKWEPFVKPRQPVGK